MIIMQQYVWVKHDINLRGPEEMICKKSWEIEELGNSCADISEHRPHPNEPKILILKGMACGSLACENVCPRRTTHDHSPIFQY